MSSKPEWLPEIISVSGDWKEVLKNLYNIFNNDFIIGKPKLNHRQIFWNRDKKNGDEYEMGFWHLVEKEYPDSEERLFDPRRAERLPWCAPMIKNCNDSNIKLWEYKESGKKINIYLWLENFNYVVIFNKKVIRLCEVAFLLTAFYVDGDSKKRNLNKKYKERIF
jgi:hypothetical protein